MKIAKILSAAAASVVAAAALAASASATLTVVSGADAGLSSGTGMWLVQVYNEGNEAENKPATDYGIDLSAVSSIEVTFEAADPDWFTGQCGGGLVFSCNGGDIASGTELWDKYNWPGKWNFWGVNDPDLTDDEGNPFVAADNQNIMAEKVGDYTYKLHGDVVNPFAGDGVSTIGCMQIGMQEWGADMSDMTVVKCDVLDASGKVLLSFDGNGKATVGGGSAVVDTGADTGSADKGSPDTGVEGVAAVAGLAVVAAGAVALSKKRK